MATTAVFAAMIGLAVPITAEAAPQGSAIVAQSSVRTGQSAELTKAVEALTPYVHRQADGTFQLVAPDRVVRAVGSSMYTKIAASVQRVNAMIMAGELVSDASLAVRSSNPDALSTRTMDGSNGLSFHWWGIEVDLDSYWTNKLVSVINAGAGAAAVAAVLAGAGVISSPGAVPAGVVSGILWIGASAIQFCSNSNGVSLYLTYTGVPWCSGQ
ncbi:hypothetical protein [Amycolatopsis xylanica]|uniref:hypothetical protein n=1 Tax=Amycolatopsis xylanica TaxID=589385 RepID=UPI00115FDD46|nr:hypothetical protein [Amycolatopsis xylanica]